MYKETIKKLTTVKKKQFSRTNFLIQNRSILFDKQTFFDWLEQCPKEFKPVFCRTYVNNIFVLFESAEHLSKFRNYFNTSHPNVHFSFEQEKNGKLSFLDIEVSREKGKFVTTVFRKPTFSGVYTHFGSFLPTIYKFGMVYTLAYRCFKICSDWNKFPEELSFLKQYFKNRVSFVIY